jgi:CP family cyanate transporter-like MFS transporter
MTRPAETASGTRAAGSTAALLAVLLVACNLRAAITSVGPVLAQIQSQLQLTSLAASVLVSLPLVAFAVVSPQAPAIAHRLGLERTLALALVALALGVLIRSLPPTALLWVGTVLLGIGIALLNVALPTFVKRDFSSHVGLVTGLYSAAQSGMAAVAAGLAVPLTAVAPGGWRVGIGVWAGLAAVSLGVLAPKLLRRSSAPASVVAPEHRRLPLRSGLAWIITAYMGLQSFGFFVLVTWLPSIEHASGVDAATAGTHEFLLNIASLAGTLICSAVLHHVSDQRALTALTSVLFGASVLGLLVAPALTALWAIGAGLSCGASLVLALSFFGLRTRRHEQAAALAGMAQSLGYLVAAVGPIGVGLVHDAAGSWTPAVLALLGTTVPMLIAGVLSGRPRTVD